MQSPAVNEVSCNHDKSFINSHLPFLKVRNSLYMIKLLHF